MGANKGAKARLFGRTCLSFFEQFGLEGVEQGGDVLESLSRVKPMLEDGRGLAQVDVDLKYQGLEVLDGCLHPLKLVPDTA
jgi:hypothetical protein